MGAIKSPRDVLSAATALHPQCDHENLLAEYEVYLEDECESEIEKMLGVALYLANFEEFIGFPLSIQNRYIFGPAWLPEADLIDEMAENFGFLVPQLPVGRYRLDLALLLAPARGLVKIAIECDGHDYHERTKEQAGRDKKRDRYLTAQGWKVFRFTGSEIYRDPLGCAEEIAAYGRQCLLGGLDGADNG